jgi:two-component system, cell cycle sensor histidine kinase and response regulator CckA
MNPIWRGWGYPGCCAWMICIILAIALVFLGAKAGAIQGATSAGGVVDASAPGMNSGGGWMESGLITGFLAVMLAAVVGYGGWWRRCRTRHWSARLEEGENTRRRLEDELKAKTEECRQIGAARDQEKRDWERYRDDSTAEKQLWELERQEVQKLKPLGVLASGIAHDFNNILTIVIGNVSLAKITACVSEDRQRWLEQAERAALRAKALTQQLLALSKEGVVFKKRAWVQDLLRDAVHLAAPGQHLRFEYNLSADLWPVEVDAGQVIHALEALIMQADRNMPEGGLLVFETVNVSLGDQQLPGLEPGDYAHLSMRTLEYGSPPGRLAQVFNSLPGAPPGDADYQLVAAHGIIKRHGGCITLESLGAKGQVFHVYLPANRIMAPEAEMAPVPPLGLVGRILVMDDEDGIRQVATVMLKQLGYETAVARDGLEALEFYLASLRSQKPFDLVILDLTVPGGLGGKETVQRLRQIDAQAKVIVSSGYFNDPVMAHYRHYGFDGVIAKPYKMEELATVVAAVVNPRPRPPELSMRAEV